MSDKLAELYDNYNKLDAAKDNITDVSTTSSAIWCQTNQSIINFVEKPLFGSSSSLTICYHFYDNLVNKLFNS